MPAIRPRLCPPSSAMTGECTCVTTSTVMSATAMVETLEPQEACSRGPALPTAPGQVASVVAIAVTGPTGAVPLIHCADILIVSATQMPPHWVPTAA